MAVDIVDDGPGFPQQVLARIGEPYISGRGGEAQHMGLGIFIAQSLLERTGARLDLRQSPGGRRPGRGRMAPRALAAHEPRPPIKETST